MSYPELLIQTENDRGYFSTAQISSNILSCFKIGRSVHPSQPGLPEHSEFLEISSRRRIRIIHIKPDNEANDQKFTKRQVRENVSRRSFRLSTEEYWFTRWNRSVRNGICNCSFRRSQRFSKDFDRLSLASNRKSGINFNSSAKRASTAPTSDVRRVQLESYAEKLLCDILMTAFKEYTTVNKIQDKTQLSGVVNLAYTENKDEHDNATLLYKDINNFSSNLFNNVNNDSNQSIKVQSVISDTNNCKNIVQLSVKHRRAERKKCLHTEKKPKPMVLLLHGIGSSAEIWWDVLQCLVCAGHEVVAPDMLGHGYSSVPDCSKAYMFANLLKDTIAVFDKYVSSTELEQCIVIGHSFGCSLASALARYREQQVVQLVLISGGGPTPLAPPVSTAEVSVFGCMQILMKPLLFCGIKRTLFYSSRGKHFDVCDSQTAVPSYVLRYISEGQNWPEGDAAFHRRILIPTLLVHGLQDTTVTLVQECEMERTIPRSFLEVIPTAGHQAMVETPEQLCHMLMCFIEWWSK